MKKVILSILILMGVSFLYADPLVTEAPIEAVLAPTCVTISTSVFTAIPASNWGQRIGLIFNNPKSNTANVHGVFGTSAPTVATRTAAIELEPGEFFAVSVDNGVTLYLVSQASGGEDICVQEFKQ